MSTPKELNSVEIVPIVVRSKKTRRDQLRFFPRCCDCGKILLDISEANIAVVDGGLGKLKRIGTHGDFEISRHSGRAVVLCWNCDKKVNRIPWQNALGTFRGLDEAQRFPEMQLLGKQR